MPTRSHHQGRQRDPISKKEHDYIKSVHTNTTAKEIADHLGRATHTIYNYMSRNHISVFTKRQYLSVTRRDISVKPGCFDVSKMKNLF